MTGPLLHGRLIVALALSAAAHVGIAWVVGDRAPASAAPAQRALSVALTPAAPRAVLNSIAAEATAALPAAPLRPAPPTELQVIETPDAVLGAQSPSPVRSIEARTVNARAAELRLQASDSGAALLPVTAAPGQTQVSTAGQRDTVAKRAPPPKPAPAAGGRPAPAAPAQRPGSTPAAGQPGANREALPAAGNAPPDYPWIARAHGHQGRVVLSVWVSADGHADRLAVVHSSGYPTLDRAAIEAVQRWRFQPARRGGQDTPSRVHVPVVFRLDSDG